ncbi:SDR family oxidoreductase [Myxococcota bacterium]|nr:SDR family oxidoreductase [Myxococcota bacterium]
MEIEGRIAIVTGAARGIGRATGVALAQAGARSVALVDVKAHELAEAADLVTDAGAEALPLEADVANLDSLRAVFAEVVSRYECLDILHNNAGIGEGPPEWPEITPERSMAVVDVNLRGVILGTHLALPIMQRGNGGAIVQTASGSAFMPLPPQAVYAATKAGVVHFTRSCIPLQETHGVRVNCVCPGLVNTDMPQEGGVDGVAPWLRTAWESANLLQPEDIAEAVLSLVRDDSKAGEVLEVDNPA